jgi:ribosomal protein L4
VGVLKNLNINRSCLVTVTQPSVPLYKSLRNVPKVAMMPVAELNAGDICNRQTMLITKDAFLSLMNKEQVND